MPMGYSIEIERKKLEAKLLAERAAELACATDKHRKRIEKEIKAEAKRQVKDSPHKHNFFNLFPGL